MCSRSIGWRDLYSGLGEVTDHGVATDEPAPVASHGASFVGTDTQAKLNAVLNLGLAWAEEANSGDAGTGDLDIGVSLAGEGQKRGKRRAVLNQVSVAIGVAAYGPAEEAPKRVLNLV